MATDMRRARYVPAVLVAATLLATTCFSDPATAAQAQAQETCVRGKPNSPIRVEVFSDYECPGCRAFYLQTMKQVFVNYADKGIACIIYREFPSYPHSRDGARWARAALRVGPRQWGLAADALFQSQPEWSRTGNPEAVVAAAIGAQDMAAVRKYANDPGMDDAIDRDAIMGLKLQVKVTPTLFITAGGKTEKAEGALTYAAMQRRLDAMLGPAPKPATRP
jgi:protein-disulfide isomerase